MEKIVLSANLRDLKIKAKALRETGVVPAQLYGAKKDNVHLQINRNDFIRIFRKSGGNTILELDIDSVGVENVLIYDVSYNPVTDDIEHIDLIRVRMDEKVTTNIPLEFVGVAMAVKDLGGVFISNLDEVEVTCLPADLPKVIEVSIDSLKTFDDAVNISDLVLPNGVEIEHEDRQVIATVVPPRSEEELASLDEDVSEDVEGVEVDEKGKDEDADGEGEGEGEGGDTDKKEESKDTGKKDGKKDEK